MHDDTSHRCRVCGEVSTDPDEDMVKIGIRHWKHFKCLSFGQMQALQGDAKCRFEAWWADRQIERKWEKAAEALAAKALERP